MRVCVCIYIYIYNLLKRPCSLLKHCFPVHVLTMFGRPNLYNTTTKGLSLSLWIASGNVQWTFSNIFRWHFTFLAPPTPTLPPSGGCV